MKSTYITYITVLLALGLGSLVTNAAQLSNKEAALWKKYFGEEVTTSQQNNAKQTNQQSSGNISGNWIGYYEYDKPRGKPAGMFNAVIKDLGEQFLITFLEPRDHREDYIQWAANSTAKRQGKYIEFTKYYGHNDTKIQYNLTVSHNGSIMDGTWKIDGNTYGTAFFYRVPLQDLKNLRQEAMKQ
jgi:hypothetical protein